MTEPSKICLSVEEEKKETTHVKRTTSSFIYFSKANAHLVKNLTYQERNEKLTSMWKKLSQAEKQPFIDLSKADKERYSKEKAKIVKPPKPATVTRPASSYIFWTRSHQALKISQGVHWAARPKVLGNFWKFHMTDAEKHPYRELARLDRERWDKGLPKSGYFLSKKKIN
jgi:hypothetical protein